MRQHSQVGQGQRFGLLPPQKDYIGVNLQATLLTWHDKGLEPGVIGLLDAARPPPVRDVDAQLHRDLAERSAGLEHLRAHSRPLKHLRRLIKCENPQSSWCCNLLHDELVCTRQQCLIISNLNTMRMDSPTGAWGRRVP